MRNLIASAFLTSAAVLGIAAGSVSAQPRHLEPGSVLIFPLFDSRPASTTVISVTNTNQDRLACTNGFRQGDVLLHYVYYGLNPETGSKCLEFDRFELLSPADTLTVLSSRHNVEGDTGYLTVAALDPESQDLIDFDFLIGSAFVANADLDIMWSYTPYPFEAIASPPAGTTCGGAINKVREGLSPLVFDGSEYAAFPNQLMVDSFFEEEDNIFSNGLTLMSTHGQDYVNEVDFWFFNNREDKFSRTFKFVCWTSLPLSEISSIARGLGGDADEFAKETGWVLIDGRALLDLSGNPVTGQTDPALLGVFVQSVRSDFTAGHALHFTGTQSNAVIPAIN